MVRRRERAPRPRVIPGRVKWLACSFESRHPLDGRKPEGEDNSCEMARSTRWPFRVVDKSDVDWNIAFFDYPSQHWFQFTQILLSLSRTSLFHDAWFLVHLNLSASFACPRTQREQEGKINSGQSENQGYEARILEVDPIDSIDFRIIYVGSCIFRKANFESFFFLEKLKGRICVLFNAV